MLVYAGNGGGDHVAILGHIILSVAFNGSSWHTWHYQDDFYLGTARVPTGWVGLMVKMPYGSGAAKAHATADYWEVDQSVKSPTVNIS